MAHPHLVVVGQDAEPHGDVIEVLVVGTGHRRVDAESDDVQPGRLAADEGAQVLDRRPKRRTDDASLTSTRPRQPSRAGTWAIEPTVRIGTVSTRRLR